MHIIEEGIFKVPVNLMQPSKACDPRNFNESNNTERDTSKVIDAAKKDYTASSTQMNDCLTDMCSNSHQIESIKKSVTTNQRQLSKLSKYQKSISNIVSQKTKVKKSSEVISLMEKIIAIRKEKDIYRKSNFVFAADKCMNGITQNSLKSVENLKSQFRTQKSIFSSITTSNLSIINKCNDVSDQLIRVMNLVSFQKDFMDFINKYKVIRYDLVPNEFKSLDFSHPCFSNITTISRVLSLQLYPYAMARMKKEFIAKDGNELTVQKGKMVLLMEDLSLPWAFVQNPYTKVMGYAPSAFLEEIGHGLGVLLEDFKTPEELLRKGDYIAIEGDCGSSNKQIRTISNGTAKISSSMIGIISEF